MKIIMTDEGMIWNPQMKCLAANKKNVIIISYYMIKPNHHVDGFKYVDIQIPPMLGMDSSNGLSSIRYRALADSWIELVKAIGYTRSVLVLSDMESYSFGSWRFVPY